MLLAGSIGSSAALTACTTAYAPAGGGYYPGAPGRLPAGVAPGGASGSAAILLPLTGSRAGIAQSMLQAAQLAMAAPGSPSLVQQDTGGTPEGAASAGKAAIAGGSRIILGPLTAPEVAAVAPIARQAQMPVLAFSNDLATAQPGVWPLGIAPAEQVRRLVQAGQQGGRTRFAALLPDNDFGHAMADALSQATSAVGMAPPNVQFHSPGMGSINHAARVLSDYDARWGPIQQQIREARAEGTSEGRRKAEQLAKSSLPPPPFDALLLADTGEALTELAAVLPYYFVYQPAVQFMGPSLWADPASNSRQMRGAWFAGPDPASRQPFVEAFSGKYGSAPPAIADVAYDAAAIARVTASSGYSIQALTNPSGFTGADGVVVLLPNGQVRRGLAVFKVEPGGAQVVEPAPASVGA